MSWAEIGGKNAKRDPDVLEMAPNTTKLVHILLKVGEEPVSYWTHYIPNLGTGGAKGRVVRCPGREKCPACIKNIYRTKRVHAINVWDYESKSVKILEGGNSIFQPMKQVRDQIGTLDMVDISIKRIGEGKDTQYSVVPIPMMTPFDPSLAQGLFPIGNLRTPHTPEEVQGVVNGMGGAKEEATDVQGVVAPQVKTELPTPTNAPTSTITLQFGKYKGKTVEDIYKEDPNYVKWCAENISDPKIKAEAKRIVDSGVRVAMQLAPQPASPVDNVLSETTMKQLLMNDINEIFQEDQRYIGNFGVIMEKMKMASISPQHPNGKTLLVEYTMDELKRLKEVIV